MPILGELSLTTRHNFRWDIITGATSGIFTGLAANFFPVVARNLGADAFLISIMLIGPFVGNLLTIFNGLWMPRRHQLAWTAAFYTVARGLLLLTFVLLVPLPFVLIVFFLYVISALPNPVVIDIMRAMYPNRWRGKLIGYVRMATAGSMMLAALVAGSLLDLWGPRYLLPLGALFGIASALSYTRVRVPEEASPPRYGTIATLSILREDRPFAHYIVAMTLWGMGFLMVSPLYPLVLIDRLHATYSQLGVLNFATALCWLASFIYWGRRVEGQGAVRAMEQNILISAFVPLIYLLSPNIWVLLLASVVNGFSTGGRELASINAMIHLSPSGRLQQYSSLINSITGVRGIAAPFIGAALVQVPWLGLSGTLFVGFVISAAGGLWLRHLSSAQPLTRVAPKEVDGGH